MFLSINGTRFSHTVAESFSLTSPCLAPFPSARGVPSNHRRLVLGYSVMGDLNNWETRSKKSMKRTLFEKLRAKL